MKRTPNDDPAYRMVTVTPGLAAQWLERNTRNRHLNDKKVNVLAAAMARGEWRENGDTICFSSQGEMLDGQHRAAAVLRSGVSIRSIVVENLSEESQLTMDVGTKRSFAANLQIMGVPSSANIAAIARMVYDYETGQIRHHNNPPTHDQLLVIVEKHLDELRVSLRAAEAVRRQLPVSATVMALAHWLFAEIDPVDCDFFFDRMRDGQGLIEGDPIFALRKAVLLDAVKSRGRMDTALLLALTIKAWNFYRTGKSVRVLSWKGGGARPESFPEPL